MEKKYLTVPFKFTKNLSETEDDEFFYFEGYASTYDNVDLGLDKVIKGSFETTLKSKKPSNIKLFYQHDAKMPLGVFEELRDDVIGLYTRAKMPKENSQVKDVMSLMKCGAIDSMSIGYVPVKYEYDDKGVRLLKEIDLFEISLVTMPMNPKAVITGMKSFFDIDQVQDIKTKREFEKCLRESGIFSNQAAIKLASYFKNPSESAEKIDGQVKELIQLINTTF
jgi:HK97 family phage prohead protease